MPVTAKQLLDAAHAVVPQISGHEALQMVAGGNTVILDVRDGTEVAASGKAAGAVHIPRGSLETRADPTATTHDKNLSPDKTIIVHCAGGGRAALAGKLLKDMGYEKVFNVGGFKQLVEAGSKIDK